MRRKGKTKTEKRKEKKIAHGPHPLQALLTLQEDQCDLLFMCDVVQRTLGRRGEQ